MLKKSGGGGVHRKVDPYPSVIQPILGGLASFHLGLTGKSTEEWTTGTSQKITKNGNIRFFWRVFFSTGGSLKKVFFLQIYFL